MKITMQEYSAFVKKYYEVQPRVERFGQFFCNMYNITDSVLFYCTDHEYMVGHISDNYLDLEVCDERDTNADDETGPFSRGT